MQARICWITLSLWWVAGSLVWGQESASDTQAWTALLRDAVQQLQLETAGFDKPVEVKVEPVFKRPHPLVQKIPTAAAEMVLNRMLGDLTRNPYRDAYVQWHLMEVIRRADDAQIKPLGDRLVRLFKDNPDRLDPDPQPEYRDEPADIAAEWHRLSRASRIVEGYPPFQRIYEGHKALERATGAQKQKIAALVAEMDKLRPQWKRVRDPLATAFNTRIRNVNFIIRQYRGELVFEMLRTRDSRMLSMVIDEVSRLVRNNQHMAFDLVAFMYAAYFNGILNDFDRAVLVESGEQLLRTAKSAEGFKQYLSGKIEVGGERNFADYAFHMVHLLQRFDEFPTAQKTEPLPRITGTLPPLPDNEPLELERVRLAIARGATALYAQEPTYTISHITHAFGRSAYTRGHHALAVWALRAVGEPVPRVNLYRRLSWVLSFDRPFTYNRSMRAVMLSQLPATFWAPWTRRDLMWMRQAMTDEGSFEARWIGKQIKGLGDNTNAFYGLMALWAAARSGQVAPHEDWKRMSAYWLGGQLPDGSWGRVSGRVEKGDKTANPVMTAAGIAALTVTQRYMAQTDPKYTPAPAELAAMDKGLAWLDKRFDLNDKAVADDWYFYMWIIQQVGHASGYRTFNGIDWYEAVTREILKRQQPNGRWDGPQGPLVSTSFAMLYLSQANASMNMAKLRFNGKWNNYRQDVYHFTQYIADLYETPINWQVVTADLPAHKLLEAPILWLSSDDRIEFKEAELKNLRQYIEGGGLLVVNQEKNTPQLSQSVQALAASLLGPDAKLETAPPDHPIYSIHVPLKPSIRMMMIENSIRPLMITLSGDVGGMLQDDRITHDAFAMLSNIYLYTKGRQAAKGRLESPVVVARSFTPRQTLKAARIDLGPGSDPEPAALKQLQAILGNEHQIRLDVTHASPQSLTGDIQVGFLAVTPQLQWSEADLEAIRRWVDGGGTLWADAVGGNKVAFDRLTELVRALEPGQMPQPLAPNSPILTGNPTSAKGAAKSGRAGHNAQQVTYRRFVLWSGLTGLRTPRLQVIKRDDRPAIIISGDDLTAGLAGLEHWRIYGYTPESARALVVNGMLHLAATQPAGKK